MKILQTLGRYGPTNQEGIFQYKRTVDGVYIDTSVGQAKLNPAVVTLTHQEWGNILQEIANSQYASFRLSGRAPAGGFQPPPHESLGDILAKAVPAPRNGWQWHSSLASYVAAILEHEGSVDLYAGPLGQGHTALICLSKDVN